MASPSGDHSKTVTGYPAPLSHAVATGYPQAQQVPAPVYPVSTFYHTYAAAAPPPSSASSSAFPGGYWAPHGPSRSFFCRVIAAVVAVFLVMATTFFIVWLVLRPRLPEFRVESASVSSLNLTGSELTATWDFSLSVTNPNRKLAIYYDPIDAAILSSDDFLLTETQVPPFHQPKRTQNSLPIRLAAASEYLRKETAKGLSNDLARGSVRFQVRVVAWVRFRSGAWRTRRHLMRVDCDELNIGFGSKNVNGSLLGVPRACQVGL